MELTSISRSLNSGAVVASSVSIRKSSRFAPRKNHLRPKILKTLSPIPIRPQVPVTIEAPVVIHEKEETVTQYDGDEESSLAELPSTAETSEGDGFRTESAVVEDKLNLGKFSTKSVFKFGPYLIGVFLFQTICAVWFLGSTNSSSRTEKLKNSELGVDGKDKEKSLINGNGRSDSSPGKVFLGMGNSALYLNEPEVERKIEEIRLMAKEARRAESKKQKGEVDGGEKEEEVPVSKSRVAIEKEITTRLNKLEKRLNSVKKSPASSKGVKSSKEAGSGLVFKKKHKLGVASGVKNRPIPKGFGSETHSPLASTTNSNSQEFRNDGAVIPNETNRSVPIKQMEVEDTKSIAGPLQKSIRESSSSKLVDSHSRATRETSLRNSRGFGGKNGATKKSPSPSTSRHEDDGARFWWLKLPCVFAILMRRGSNSEGPEGLYTLKITSDEDDESVSSYIVGFEDRADANNFCYLLESFFEGLGDFAADIVPLLRKELEEAVQAKTMRIFVLRKGQLRIYAGQPFFNVESELMSLVEENQSDPR